MAKAQADKAKPKKLPTNSKKVVSKKPTSTSRSRILALIVCVLMIALLSFGLGAISNYRERSKVKKLVADMDNIKSGLEKELGVSFTKTASCTQNQGLYENPDANWGCRISISSQSLRQEIHQSAEEFIETVDGKKGEFSYSDGTQGTGFIDRNNNTCGSHFIDSQKGYSFGCSFGVSNGNIKSIKKYLGIIE